MLVKNFAKEIQYQMAHETLKNPLNYLKTVQNLREKIIKQNILWKAVHVPKKKQ